MDDEEFDDRRKIPRPEPDRRETPRRRSVLSGYIFFDHDEHVLPVRVSNLSETGAKLRLEGLRPLPDRFAIAIPQHLMVRVAVVAWKRLPEFGVRFLDQPSPEVLLRIDSILAKLR